MTPSQKLYTATRGDIFACMETNNLERARTVLENYEDVVRNSETLDDLTKELKAEIVEAYGLSL